MSASLRRLLAAVALAVPALAGHAVAATHYVNGLGAATGWWSDDTRSSSGIWLNGKTETVPGYHGPSTPAGTTEGDDAIDLQIEFGDFYPGSDDGSGVVRLWPTNDAPGKASIGTFDYTTGFVSTASLLTGFTVSYRMYVAPAPTQRTPVFRLNFATAGGVVATFLHFPSPMSHDTWMTVDLDQASTWSVYRSGTGWIDNSGASPKTMAQWAASRPEYFAVGSAVFGVGFNIGSDQRQCYYAVDWLETSLLDGGNRIDFGTYGWTLRSTFLKTTPKADTDRWAATGDLVVESAAALSADILSGGLVVSIAASSATSPFTGDTDSFSASDCNATSATDGVRCENAAGSLVRLRPRASKPNEYQAAIRVRKREFSMPALADAPLSVTISAASALDAVASASDCRSLLADSKIECTN